MDLSEGYVAVLLGLFVALGLAYMLYRPRVQESERYQAMVVPLANIMDVGFIVLSPAIVLLVGYAAPIAMLAICLVAIATGFVMAYNIRNYEPLRDTGDPAERVERVAQWSLLGASVVNIAYYTLLLMALLLLPLDAFTQGRQTVLGVIYLAVIAIIGFFGGMAWLNRQGDRTTAFNIAAVIGVLVTFLVFNLQLALTGKWAIGESPAIDTEALRKVIGLFAMVQGFEASRYIGVRFAAETRISTMRIAQYLSTAVFVILILSLLVFFLPPAVEAGGTAIFNASAMIGDAFPWLLLMAAIGSQSAAIIGATSSRSDMLVNAKVPRRLTFLMILIPAILVLIFTDINVAVSLASRVFAAFFMVQCTLAGYLAWRKKTWGMVLYSVIVGLAMATILIFGLPL